MCTSYTGKFAITCSDSPWSPGATSIWGFKSRPVGKAMDTGAGIWPSGEQAWSQDSWLLVLSLPTMLVAALSALPPTVK